MTPARKTRSPSAPPKPVHLANRSAAEETIDALNEAGRLDTVDSARIATLRALADAVDADGANASLWREYRAAEAALREVHDDGTDDFAALVGKLSASVVDPKNAKPKDPRTRSSRGR